MLVLSRKANEKFHFPALGISIQVVNVKDSHVKLGIEAPREFRVLREELMPRSSDYRIKPTIAKSLGASGVQLRKAVEAVEAAGADDRKKRDATEALAETLDLAEIQRQLDAINLALFAVQSEMGQDVDCQQGLDEAMAALRSVEVQLAMHPDWRGAGEQVSEPSCGYSTRRGQVVVVGRQDELRWEQIEGVIENLELGTVKYLGMKDLLDRWEITEVDAVLIPVSCSAGLETVGQAVVQVPSIPGMTGLQIRGYQSIDDRVFAIFQRQGAL